jgi:hypothetical protein
MVEKYYLNLKVSLLFIILAPSQVLAIELLSTSLIIPDESMTSKETGILHRDNLEKRGKEWERRSILLIKDSKGKSLVTQKVGVRLHGGHSRQLSDPSFKVYFRKKYGKKKLKKGLLFDSSIDPIKSLLIHRANDLINLVAFDISKISGANVPEYIPTLLLVNNKPWGLYFLGEHLNLKNWLIKEKAAKRRSSKDKGENISYHKFKELFNLEEENLIEKDVLTDEDLLRPRDLDKFFSARELRKTKELFLSIENVDLEFANRHVRINNLISHLLSIVITGNTDWRQGIAVRENDKDQKWHFINWDMEHSFFDKNHKNIALEKGLPFRPLWKQEGLELILASGVKWWKEGIENQRPLRKWDIRAVMFFRLWDKDPEFRNLVISSFKDIETKLDVTWVKAEIKKYAGFMDQSNPSVEKLTTSQLQMFFKCRFQYLNYQFSLFKTHFDERDKKRAELPLVNEESIPTGYNKLWKNSQEFNCKK